MNQTAVTHEQVEVDARTLAQKLMALGVGDTITFNPPLGRALEEWLFRVFRIESEVEMQFKCTRTDAPGARGLKKFFGELQLHTMTRTQ